MNFKTRIKELRESRGLTQKELSEQLNEAFKLDKVYPQTISYWENGREPNLNMLLRLAQFFDVSTDYLLGNTDKLNMSEISFDNNFETILNKSKLNSFIENLPDNLKTAFYDMFNDHINSLNLSDGMSCVFYPDNHIRNYDLDYMYIVTRISKLISNFECKIISCFLEFNSNLDNQIVHELDFERCTRMNSISLETVCEFTNLLNEFIKFYIYSLNNSISNSDYEKDNPILFFKKEIFDLLNQKEKINFKYTNKKNLSENKL
ncbi:hypothetical protein HMPREF1092_00563 [Clostridium thermobutyricum]|uniref:HTH cro/C1-type domain-containing protein n=1 Tax=Clostridium thermobutyricum TaxID=29372 RepID=N9Y6E8_9CLOT|nr:helix-turn-helix transcriptional regulator [Clostridium thermobutyricum]ENZ03377.1 hypothetical protein HMPREF1092_00563 [Clostridium thermobutyricum]